MEIVTTVIGASAFAAFIVPIVWVHQSQDKKKKKELENFKTLAFENTLEIYDYDNWNHKYFIGLDEIKQQVIYQNKNKNSEEATIIDLHDFKDCKIERQTSKLNGSSDSIIENVNLVFINEDKSKPNASIEIYSTEYSMNIKDEIEIANKWQQIIKKNMKQNS